MSCDSWLFKSWNIEAEDLIITKWERCFFYDNDGCDDDNNNDDNDDGGDENEKNV